METIKQLQELIDAINCIKDNETRNKVYSTLIAYLGAK